ncbi:unnamed protein product [Mytilus coruscus]|uniref:Uncharacterized protein n=1 Tax=Mytilus coruscus TaxID=42192 RepID=A0A6J8CH45_MYTCO|nr:unnamed protein product [Mytilus coruscus]
MMVDLDLPEFHSGKTRDFIQFVKLKIGKTTIGELEEVSTSVLLKEIEGDCKASVVKVVEPYLTADDIDGNVNDTSGKKDHSHDCQNRCDKNDKLQSIAQYLDGTNEGGIKPKTLEIKAKQDRARVVTPTIPRVDIVPVLSPVLFSSFGERGKQKSAKNTQHSDNGKKPDDKFEEDKGDHGLISLISKLILFILVLTGKNLIWIILGCLILGVGGIEDTEKCTGIGLKVEGTFIEGSTATFTVQKQCETKQMTAAPNGQVLLIVTNEIVEVNYKKMVTSEVCSTRWTITIDNLTSSNLSTVYEFTCSFDCQKTKRLSQYRKGNRAHGMTFNLVLTCVCCLLTCLLWIMH